MRWAARASRSHIWFACVGLAVVYGAVGGAVSVTLVELGGRADSIEDETSWTPCNRRAT